MDGVEGPQQRLAAAIERIVEAGVATLFDRALLGANLAPVAGSDIARGAIIELLRRGLTPNQYRTDRDNPHKRAALRSPPRPQHGRRRPRPRRRAQLGRRWRRPGCRPRRGPEDDDDAVEGYLVVLSTPQPERRWGGDGHTAAAS